MESKGKRWTSESDNILENLYKTKGNLNDIATQMGRTRGAIEARLSKLLSKEAETLSLDEISKKYERSHQEIQGLINSRWNIESKEPEVEKVKERHNKDRDLIKKLEEENRFLRAKIDNVKLRLELKNLSIEEY